MSMLVTSITSVTHIILSCIFVELEVDTEAYGEWISLFSLLPNLYMQQDMFPMVHGGEYTVKQLQDICPIVFVTVVYPCQHTSLTLFAVSFVCITFCLF